MRKVISFLKEARAELAKVVWPTRRRTARLTVIVVIATVIFGAFIGAVDYGLDRGLQAVLDTTGAGQSAGPPLQEIPGANGGAPAEIPADAVPQPQSTE
ncbi:MAG: preprotein translocase subunit SecE [bacterium]|nr:preprotein translocase subunit SecE [bacterium]